MSRNSGMVSPWIGIVTLAVGIVTLTAGMLALAADRSTHGTVP
jgi:hypothetical protein